MLFQSIGAHYSAKTALRHLFRIGARDSVAKLETELANKYGGKAIVYHKGRAALSEAVRLATGGTGTVAITALTCYSVPQAVWAAGVDVEYVEIREQDLQFGAEELEAAIQRNPAIRAVIIQNTLGIPADIKAIERVAQTHNIAIIEDLAHAAGASYADGREVGTVGDYTMLSFGKDKALDVVNGGALIIRTLKPAATIDRPTELPSFIERVRDRIYPLLGVCSRALYAVAIGKVLLAGAYKLRLAVRSADGPVRTHETMPAWQASLAREQVANLPDRVALRQAHTKQIVDSIHAFLPQGVRQADASLVRVPFLVDDRGVYIATLREKGIFVQDIWYDVPVSPIRYYANAQFSEKDYPIATSVAARLFNVPTHENVTSEAIATIAATLNEVKS